MSEVLINISLFPPLELTISHSSVHGSVPEIENICCNLRARLEEELKKGVKKNTSRFIQH